MSRRKPKGKVKARKALQRNAHATVMLKELQAAASWFEQLASPILESAGRVVQKECTHVIQ